MKLKKLLKDLNVEVRGSREIEITGLSSHSQFVAPGSLFIAKKGQHFDGTEFISKAIEIGAVAVLTDFYNPFLQGVVQIITQEINAVETLLAERYYGIHESPLYFIGVTGTNGKTTTAYLIHHLLPKCGLMGTIETVIKALRFPSQLTTSDLITNHKVLKEMQDAGLKAAVMEVTSHALDQNRVAGIPFDAAIFTNFSQDHLDYHGTMEAYLKAKLKLAEQSKSILYNGDDPAFKELRGFSFGIESDSDLKAEHLSSLKSLQTRLKSFPGVPGRLERIDNGLGLQLFVDFAHTPDALAKVLETLSTVKKGRIITIFGCGGERDKLKRPKMAEAAERYSDLVIITSDNPRGEDPHAICSDVERGLTKQGVVEVDRYAAIEKGMMMAKQGDTVLIAGRGHEPFQQIGGRRIPFDDRAVVAQIAQNLLGQTSSL